MRILMAQINPIIGDLTGNTQKILSAIDFAKKEKADLVLFPELALTGYPPDDFLLLPHFIKSLTPCLQQIQEASKGIIVVVGTPRRHESKLLNSAAIFENGRCVGYQDKTLLPTYDVFAERRYFEPADQSPLWSLGGKKIGITICEDLWQHSSLLKDVTYDKDPVCDLAKQKPDLVLNLSASPYSLNKPETRSEVVVKAAKTLKAPLLLCNQVGGNDGLIFDGCSLYVDGKGQIIAQAKKFAEDLLIIDLEKSKPAQQIASNPIADLYYALRLGVHDYFTKSGFSKACLGISGGIDSALVACIAVDALGAENVLGVAMPSRYSSGHSVTDAEQLAKNLKMPLKKISIEQPFCAFLDVLGPHFENRPSDAAEENLQARLRGNILMALSNKFGYIVLSTGNKSELAMGYATLYGDMCGGLGVINDITKRQVYQLAQWINRDREIIPLNTIKKDPSAELRPNQRDSDSLPPYDVIDNVLTAYVEEHLSPQEIAKQFQYPLELVENLIKRIHMSEYKRRQSPPGLRVSEKAFWIGRKFPIVQRWVTC